MDGAADGPSGAHDRGSPMSEQPASPTARRLRSPVAPPEDGLTAAQRRILETTTEIRIRDPHLARLWIEDRQRRGIDQYDEVWEGVYVVPPLANNPHQDLVCAFSAIFYQVLGIPGKGRVLPGANVSDRREDWQQNFRAPDVVVVLKEGRAVDCGTHWLGGPDFLVEIESPRDETEAKIPFYSSLHVREVLIVHRDTRHLRLLRHDGQSLALAGQSEESSRKWIRSEVIPFAFRWKATRDGPRTELKRTDGQRQTWTV
jgi:hypothetical protein